ncbi:hypothetical protein ACKGJN_16120, partial [Gillisia sp. Q332]
MINSHINLCLFLTKPSKSKKLLLLTLALVWSFISAQLATAQVTSTTYNTTTTWTVPAGVTTVQVEAWGGGGSGGGVATAAFDGGAGGAGGGAYARSLISVVPGQTYTITVGAGSSTIAAGGSSWFINSTTILAVGGNSSAVANDSQTGASGGAAASSIGSVVYSGGNGANGTSGTGGYGGGAGSSAGNASTGINGSFSNGGIATLGQNGGNGGNGAIALGSGINGVVPGGGGGGAYRPGTGGSQNRSTGANGRIIITYGCVSPLSATVTVSNISCNGLIDGSIVVSNPSGGAGTYQYRLNSGTWQSSGSFAGLGAGTYNVQMRDAANPFCEISLGNRTITNPPALSATVSKTDINCFGANNGAITVNNPLGGNGTYQVSINGTNWFAVSTGTPYTFTNLSPNTYSVQIRDAAFPSCVVSLGNQTIIQPAVLNASVAKTNISCFEDNDGTIKVSFPSGGGGTYQVSIDNISWSPITSGGSYTFSNLAPNTYTVRIRDAAVTTCVVVLGNQTITQPPALTANAVGTQPSCFAGGSIDLTVEGGTAPYTYNWSDLSGANNPQDRSGLDPGTYSVTVTDANGCQISASSITLIAATNCDGIFVCREEISTVSVDAIPGATGYSWTLPFGAIPSSGTIIQTTPLVIVETTLPTIDVNWSSVDIGKYNVCVEPTNDCGPGTEQCREIFVNEVILDITPNDILCRDAADGSIFLQVTQGIGPFTFAWTKVGDPGYTASVQNPEGLTPGTYNVTVTDSKGCVKTASATITEPVSSIAVTAATIVNEDPFGASNGSIDITVSGGSPGYTYAWTGPNGFTASTEDISVLVGGTYVVAITDANGCTLIQSYTVQRIGGPLEISSLTKTDVLCFGQSTGTISLEVIGGLGTYTYIWVALSGGPVPAGQENNQDLTDLPAGEYQVTVSDGTNPDVIQSITVNQPAAALNASAVATDILCFGANNGSIDLTVTGGTAPYTYLWNNGSAAQNLINIGPGTYNVTITDANGCTTTASATVTQPPALVISGDVTNASCNIVNSGAINLSVSGGTPGYTYAWSNGATTEDISSLSPGVYTVVVTDANGCEQTASFTVRNLCLDVTKTLLGGPTNNGNGTYTLTYQVAMQNTGNTALQSVQVVEDLAATYSTFSGVSISSAKFTLNGSYTGIAPNTNLLSTGQTLVPGEQGLINITLTVTPGTFNNPYTNTVDASAQDANGLTVSDTDTEAVTFIENPIIGVAKALTAGPSILPDGSYNLSFTLTVRNYGDVPLNNVQVTDNLDAAFGAGTYSVTALSASAGFTVNGSFNGSSDQNLLSASTAMAINEIRTIVISLNVTPTTAGPFANQASGTATGPGGTSTTDVSQNGLNPDPDNDGNPGNNNVVTPATFPENPEIGLAKRLVGTPINNNDGTYTVNYEFNVKNTGDVILYNVQVTDNLTTTFSGAPVVVKSINSTGFTVNDLYTGTGINNLLSETGNTLAVGETKIITLSVDVAPTGFANPPPPVVYNNSATSAGTSAFGTTVNDISHNGIDVDPENDGTGNNSDPTPVTFAENPKMGLAKAVSSTMNNNDGTYDVTYTIYVKNYGDVPLNNVQVTDNLTTTFTGATSYTVKSISASGTLAANTVGDFNTTNNLLLAASSTVAYNTTQTITLVVRVTPGTKLGIYNNSATGTAIGPGETSVTDVSQNGINPDPGGGNNPGNFSQPTPVSFSENPAIAVTKTIVGSVSKSGDNYTLTYQIKVENMGDVPLYNLQLNDDLATAFADASGYVVNSTTISTQPSTALVRNTNYNGGTNPELLDGNGTLLFGEFAVIQIQVTVTAISGTNPGGPYINEVASLANSPAGRFLIDLDDVAVTLFENPAIQLTKTVESVVDNGDGTNRVTFKLLIENTGDVNLYDLKIYDDIVTQFAAFNPTNFAASEGLSLAVNPLWNGTATSNILDVDQYFDPEVTDPYYVFISFDVTPGFTASQVNIATASGTGPLGGIATGSDTETVNFLTPAISLDKQITSGSPYNAVGELINYSFVITNTGGVTLPGPFTINDDKIGLLTNCANGPLAVGATITCTASYTVTSGDLTAGSVTNTATASTTYAGLTVTSNQDQATAEAGAADIGVVKTVNNSTPLVGSQVTFTIVVTNYGPAPARDVVVVDQLPNGYTYVGHNTATGTYNNTSPYQWTIGDMPLNGTATLSIIATVNEPGPGIFYTNTASKVPGEQVDLVSGNNSDDATVVPQQADLAIAKTVDDATPNVGDVVTFTLTVTNLGTDNATGVSVEDVVPAGYGTITNISGGGTLTGSTITWSGLSVTTATPLELTFQATVLAPTGAAGEYLNTATITDSDQYDPDTGNNTDDQLVTPQQ